MKHLTKPKKVKGWACPECDELREDEQDAIDCCPHEAEPAERWQCGECEETYDDREDAKECCK